jgi:hypothetical protein
MSTTPRTDAVDLEIHIGVHGDLARRDAATLLKHARQLELENIKLLEQNNQLKIDIALVREQHNQEMKECKSDEALIAENTKLLEVARAAKVLLIELDRGHLPEWWLSNDRENLITNALKSLEEAGVKI